MILQPIYRIVNFSWRFMQEEMVRGLERRMAIGAKRRTAPVSMTGKKMNHPCNKQVEG